MKKEIRDMIRQRQVTGEKVGQAMIRDLVTLYQVQRDAQDLGAQPLTESEKAQLVAALDTPEEVAVYSQYKYVINYLQQVLLHHTSAWQDVEINFLRLYAALSPLDDTEQLLGVIHRFPPLMEEEAYEQAVALEQHRRQEGHMTSAQAVLGLCLWLMMRPGEPLHAEARRAMTGESFFPEHPEPFLSQLRLREPVLYQGLLARAEQVPGFSGEDLSRPVSYAAVEAAFPGLYEGVFGSAGRSLFPDGFAIPRRGAAAYDPMEIEGIGVVALLDRLGNQLTQAYRHFLSACRHTLAVETAVLLLSERIDVPELEGFLQPASLADRLSQVRQLFDRLPLLPQGQSPGETEALAERVAALFPRVEFAALRPKERAMQATRKALADLSILERATALHQLLMEEGGAKDGP